MAAVPGPDRSHPSFSSSKDRSRLEHVVEELFEQPASSETCVFPARAFSGTVALQAGSGPVVEASQSPEQVRFPPDKPLNVLSVGKLFTAVAAMQLIEDGVHIGGREELVEGRRVVVGGKPLSLDTPLQDLLTPDELDVPLKPPYLKDKPDAASLDALRSHSAEICLEHLLSHTAGFTQKPAGNEEWSPEGMGEYSYSNYGYQLLAIIIGKHSKCGNKDKPEAGFKQHVRERIFAKADMTRAGHEMDLPSTGSSPARFDLVEGRAELVNEVEPYPHGNGCWHMPASDLVRFGQAVNQNKLINKATFHTMLSHKPHPLGFKIEEKTDGTLKFWGHPGHGPGQSADLCSFYNQKEPANAVTAAALSNYSNGADVAHELFERKFTE